MSFVIVVVTFAVAICSDACVVARKLVGSISIVEGSVEAFRQGSLGACVSSLTGRLRSLKTFPVTGQRVSLCLKAGNGGEVGYSIRKLAIRPTIMGEQRMRHTVRHGRR